MATTHMNVNGRMVPVKKIFQGYSTPQDADMDYRNFIMNSPKNYVDIANAKDYDSALAALGRSPYEPNGPQEYARKVSAMKPKTDAQTQFFTDRYMGLRNAGMPDHLALLGAQQSALETGWGKHLANENNFYGIKGSKAYEPNRKVAHPMDTMPGEQPAQGLYDTAFVPDAMQPQQPQANCGGPGQMPCPQDQGGSDRDYSGFAKAGLGFMAQDPAYQNVFEKPNLQNLMGMMTQLGQQNKGQPPVNTLMNFFKLFGGR